MRRLRYAFFLLLLAPPPLAAAPTPDDLGGTLLATVGGRPTHLPSLKTEYQAEIRGDVVAVKLTQRFVNPGPTPVNATYMFPLQEDAAVHAMRMETDTEAAEAVIREKEEARQEFEQAKREGRNAALLTQHRPNVFTQEIANLMPGRPITIRLRYVQAIPRVDGAYELVMPLVVGPRYEKPTSTETRTVSVEPMRETAPAAPSTPGQWSFDPMPQHPPVTGLGLPAHIDSDRVAITVRLDTGGLPIENVESRTHGLARQDDGTGRSVITLASGRTLDNKDFVLRYKLAGRSTQAALQTHRDDRGGFFNLLIEPPVLPPETDIAAREMVFLLDASGSMAGLPMDASKAFMRKALRTLRPTDFFRIIRFSDGASEFSSAPLPANPTNIRAGLAYVEGLQGEGGTDMSAGIRQALGVSARPDVRRIVVFLTDGYIGGESEVLGLVSRMIGNARLYAFGVGTGVNRYLLMRTGQIGGGFTRFMDPTDDSETVVNDLVARLRTPVLTDISIDWGDLKVSEVTPGRIPDLFTGDSIRIAGRFDETRSGRIVVRGEVNGRAAELPLDVNFAVTPASGGEALPIIWARARIAEHMTDLMGPAGLRPGGASDLDIRRAVTKLGLDFSLATQWTSFVAVARDVVNPSGVAADKPVPVPQVSGVGPGAYPPEAFGNGSQGGGAPMRDAGAAPPRQTVSLVPQHAPLVRPRPAPPNGGRFSGGPTPEPGALGGLALMAGLGWIALRRRRRKTATQG